MSSFLSELILTIKPLIDQLVAFNIKKYKKNMRVATDIGGTFTDLVCLEFDEKSGKPIGVKVAKTDTTPGNFEEGILNAIEKINLNLNEVDFFAHGTTVVINALTEHKGAKTALITTKGFRDVLEIARAIVQIYLISTLLNNLLLSLGFFVLKLRKE